MKCTRNWHKPSHTLCYFEILLRRDWTDKKVKKSQFVCSLLGFRRRHSIFDTCKDILIKASLSSKIFLTFSELLHLYTIIVRNVYVGIWFQKPYLEVFKLLCIKVINVSLSQYNLKQGLWSYYSNVRNIMNYTFWL